MQSSPADGEAGIFLSVPSSLTQVESASVDAQRTSCMEGDASGLQKETSGESQPQSSGDGLERTDGACCAKQADCGDHCLEQSKEKKELRTEKMGIQQQTEETSNQSDLLQNQPPDCDNNGMSNSGSTGENLIVTSSSSTLSLSSTTSGARSASRIPANAFYPSTTQVTGLAVHTTHLNSAENEQETTSSSPHVTRTKLKTAVQDKHGLESCLSLSGRDPVFEALSSALATTAENKDVVTSEKDFATSIVSPRLCIGDKTDLLDTSGRDEAESEVQRKSPNLDDTRSRAGAEEQASTCANAIASQRHQANRYNGSQSVAPSVTYRETVPPRPFHSSHSPLVTVEQKHSNSPIGRKQEIDENPLTSESHIASQVQPLLSSLASSSSFRGKTIITQDKVSEVTAAKGHPSSPQDSVSSSNIVTNSPVVCVPVSNSLSHSPAPSTMAVSPSASQHNKHTLRRGKWTVEEEAYVARVIQEFNSGYLNAPAGTTLRTYLSEKLHCDPMRITKKFTGDACIGKRVFHPAVRCASNAAAIDKAQAELDALERRWRRRLEMQHRESAKKAAASAAAAAAAASGRNPLHPHVAPLAGVGILGSTRSLQQSELVPNSQQIKQNVVAQTASWLDRANAILSTNLVGEDANNPTRDNPTSGGGLSYSDQSGQVRSLPPNEVEDQIKEVQRLIHEGPMIQQTSAGLPRLLENATSVLGDSTVFLKGSAHETEVRIGVSANVDTRSVPANSNSTVGLTANSSPNVAPVKKRKILDGQGTFVPCRTAAKASELPASYSAQQNFYDMSSSTKAFSISQSESPGLTTNTTKTYHVRPQSVDLPQDKGPRRSFSANHLTSSSLPSEPSNRRFDAPSSPSGAEDAEALVGFLNSIRASAASSSGASRRFSG